MVIVAAIVFGVLYPRLGELWSQLLLGGLVAVMLLFLSYNGFAAGWQPGRATDHSHDSRDRGGHER